MGACDKAVVFDNPQQSKKGLHKVYLEEFESGWGSRIDETLYFRTHADAEAYCNEFNAHNDEPEVPDWYMIATYVGVQ